MKKIYILLIALTAGFGLAFLAAGVSSYFFILLPIIAFVLGYYASWRWGLMSGLLLFVSYTLALTLIWRGGGINLSYPLPYILAFTGGGFSLLIIGALAPGVKIGVKRAGSITVLSILAVVTGWCGYTAIPQYSYYYQVAVQSSEDLNKLELYMPVGTVSGEPRVELYDEALDMPTHLTGNFTQEIVETEQGKMLKITIFSIKLADDKIPVPQYDANIIFREGQGFWKKTVPYRLIQLTPKSEVVQIDATTSRRFAGPVKSKESKLIEKFNVPVKVTSNTPAQIKLRLWNRTDREVSLNFAYAYSKSDPYVELINSDIPTNSEWVYLPVQVTSLMEITGISD